jgi:endonuclease/exonuclease/phosphatase family metal-dependent hydrolase
MLRNNVLKMLSALAAGVLMLASCGKENPGNELPPPGTDEELGGPAADLGFDLSVMSFNVRLLTSSDTGEKAWVNRKKPVCSMIKDKKPMVIGVQECYISQRDDIMSGTSGYIAYGVGRDDGKSKGETTSLLYDSSVLTMKEFGTYWLSETPDKASLGWDAACKRTATWALMQHKGTGKRFYVVNTHLDHVGTTAQTLGMKLIKEKTDAMNRDGLPVIVMGDMNLEPGSAAFAVLGMENTREVAKKSDNIGTFSSKLIDHIFFKGLDVLSYETINGHYDGTTYLSDHRPIMSTFNFRK